MHPKISNLQAWASSNDYSLLAQTTPGVFTVVSRGSAVGVVVRNGTFFEFHPLQDTNEQPQISTSSDEEWETDTQLSTSFGLSGFAPIELNTATKDAKELTLDSRISGTGNSERVLDCNYWLPYAAEQYDLSRDIRDYILVPVPSIFSGLPNTNGEALSLKEMLSFKPEYGRQMYKTFKGEPTHWEHDNLDIRKARGVILESFLRPVPFNPSHYKIVLLLAFDRTKDAELCKAILEKRISTYSVGFSYSSYTCSICGHQVGRGISLTPCVHTKLKQRTYRQRDGQIVFRNCLNAKGFECSAVATPAFISAIGGKVIDPQRM